MNEKQLAQEFKANEHLYAQLETEGLFILTAALKQAGIKLHSTGSRIKSYESIVDKAKRKQLGQPLSEVRDIVGLRVVCLFVSDIERIGQLIRRSFLVLSEDDKIEGAEASSFGYMSVHFDVTMKKEHKGPRYDPIAGLPFEIQVRTIAMDAWANVSHHLSYKSDKDVPSELRKDFYALSGLFYVADRHFEMFYDISKKSQVRMTKLFEEAKPQVKAEQEINLDSLRAYLITKFPDRTHSDAKGVSSIVDELLRAGYRSIGQVDQLLDSSSKAFGEYEKKRPPGGRVKAKFADVGVVRISGRIADDKFIQASDFDGVMPDKKTFEEVAKEYKEFRKFL